MNERLAAKVRAVNAANEYARELYPRLVAVFKPLVGQQVLKADGTLVARVAKLLPNFPTGNALHVYLSPSAYSLSFIVKTCENVQGGYTCTYHETSVYVGDIQRGVLTKLCQTPEHFRSDYTVAEVETNRATYKEAQKKANELKSKLYPFGEYDN